MAPQRSRKASKSVVLLVLCVSLFMAMLDNTIVNTALPTMSRRLGAGISDLQWIIDAYSLSLAAFMLTASTVGDLFGRRRVFVQGLLVFTAGSALCGLSSSVSWVICGRAIQGLGVAAFLPATLAVIRAVYTDEKERSFAIGVWAGVSGLGLGLGPLLGGPLVDHFGWPSVFLVNVPVGIVGAVAAVVIPESADRDGRGLDLRGQVLVVLGLGTLVFATIEGPNRGWRSPEVLACYAGAIILLAAFVVVELRSRSPLLDIRALRDRVLTGAILSGLFLYFGMFSLLYFLSLWLQQVLGWSATGAGLVIMPAMVVVAAVTPIAGLLTARIGGGYPMTAGLLICAVALVGLSRYGAHASFANFWWLLPVIGLGMGLTLTPITAMVISRVPASRAGMGSATSNTARELGGVLGVAALGSVLTARMTATLRDNLQASGLPAGRIAEVVAAQGRSGSPVLTIGEGATHRAVLASFVDGLHVAELCGAAVLLVAALLAVILVRSGRTADGTQQDGESFKGSAPSAALGR